MRSSLRLVALALVALLCAAAHGGGGTPAYAPAGGREPSAAQLAALGRAMFFDASLSASGRIACASCHDPRHAYGPSNALSVQLAGRDGRRPGTRAAPSLRYLQTLPPFSEHHFDNDGDDSIDGGPTGGHDWDGRASSAHEQARGPLLSPLEMANASPAAVVEHLRRARYAARFREAFGERIFDDADAAFRAALMALEVFQQTPAEFYPYSSKYDAVLRGRATLTPQEARGLALFNDPAKGNCASCHPSAVTADGAFPAFTDFGHVALGVPRNAAILANADPRYHDLGLCGPLRSDLAQRPEYCGRFRTPTLRNVAVRRSFFHNGVFHRLDDVLRFYAQRDVQPQRFYKGAKFDDLPSSYRANVNMEAPFGRRTSALSESEIGDLIAFLKTLTDADQLPAKR
jgi:cytochrome c peroxidase